MVDTRNDGKKIKKGTLCGLTTYDALEILHDDIQRLLKKKTSKKTSWWTNLRDIFHVKNECSSLSWISIFLICLNGFILIFTSFFINSAVYGNLVLQGIFIILLAVINVSLVVWDDGLRLEEIPTKINNLLKFVKECQDKCMWRPENYPHLCSPYSPCITLQWTYRDGTLVNLPWALLCRGDVILLRPGQTAPGNCVPHDNSGPALTTGEVYSPPQKHDNISTPAARVPLPNKRYIMQETPLLRNVEEVLESALPRRTVTSHDRQRNLVMVGCVLHLALPLFALCTVLVNVLRYVYVGQWVGNAHWSVMFFLLPASVSIPLLPLCFPIAWISLNTFGTAKLSAFLQSSYSAKTADPFDDISIDEKVEELATGTTQWGQHFLHALLGQQHSLGLTRSVNPLHILGSVTALCCVDKKGILSWPNPTAEKVFFLRTSKNMSHVPSQSSLDDTNEDILEDIEEETNGETDTKSLTVPHGEEPIQTVGEVLDLTHDLSCPFRLHFDDTRWKEYIGSLKPIGLAILLNTCNMATQEHYVQFCSHVTCEALYNEDLVPVTNRRCLCELSKQIGFTDEVVKSFTLLEQLSTFRHVQPEAVRRDIKFARSLALATKLKLPFPHMVSVVTSEVSVPKSLQLFSQATGDIALDSCVDFWDGNTLRVLSSSDRKKVLDFYQRTSLTAYCTAFAYRPLSRGINHMLSNVYMELPPDSHYLYLRSRSPTPLIWPNPTLSQSIDSLLAGEGYEEDVSDIEGCFEMQCNQIFLGMVTMQYQAQIEMVQLIDQLEGACIRFVHFSKENELRSRVFSEKMGLESGWNCHISLLSNDSAEPQVETEELVEEEEKQQCSFEAPLLGNTKRGSLEGSKNMSISAPSAINTESVKPKTELNPSLKAGDEDDAVSQQDGWQSLSCLTDSTEQSAHINFDMSNRAKLPRGIDQIRPHLENVDNVPLLVSLFTDCTPATTQQMIEIMQEYGEIVCVIGSSANADNCGVFLKADASVSVEPLYPQVCQKVPVYTASPDVVSPVQLSQRLNSLPCSVAITRQRPVSLFHLIMHARHYMQSLWNCIQFWVCCTLALSAIQVITAIVMLPPLFSTGQVLWLSCIVIPLLSVSLVFAPTNLQVMTRPASKIQFSINSEVAVFALWCYGSKFLPTLLVVPSVYAATLTSHCQSVLKSMVNNNTTCSVFYPVSSEPWGGWQSYYQPLFNAQLWCALLLVFHFALVSISFVHREYLTWLRSPLKNKMWLIVSCSLVLIQFAYTLIIFITSTNENYDLETPWIGIIVACASPPIIFLVNEFIKWQEIKANVRYEKRARLEFGTKLGMNSPF